MATTKQTTPKSSNRVDLTKEIRRQKRTQRLRRRAIFMGMLVVTLAVALAYLSGAFSTLYSVGKTWNETVTISTATQAGFPAQTGISNIYQTQTLSGGFVALGEESCVVFSDGGNRLRSIQSGYLRPAISAGTTRYLLYSRAGNELRVESRTETLYTKTTSNSILLASISDNGSVAVVTESDRYLANLTMYSSSMTELLSYSMTDSEGIPIRMEYASDNKTLAVATVSASGGQMLSRVYLITSAGVVDCIDTQTVTPLAIEWLSDTKLCILYEDTIVLYDANKQTILASYDYSNKTLADYAVYGERVALLFSQSVQSEVVLLQDDFDSIATTETDALVNSIALDETRLYLVYDKAIETYSYTLTYAETEQMEQKILGLLVAEQLYLFTSDEVSIFAPPTLAQE